MLQYLIYKGARFTVEWFYDERGNSQAREYYQKLTLDRKKQLDRLVRHMGDFGKIKNKEKFRHEDDQIYAFKPKPDRFLCFFIKGAKIIVTNAFEKKSDKLPIQEKEKALWYRQDYIHRTSKGTYYAKEKNK